MSRCKFCGKELQWAYWNLYDTYDYCTCEGQKKFNEMCNEIRNLESQLNKKRKELRELELSGAYGELIKQKNSLEWELEDFKDASYEER